MARIVHFVLHVPKCAGTTIEDHFAAALGPGFLLAPRWESVLRNVLGNRYPYAPGDPRLAAVRLVSGHSLSRSLGAHFPGAEIRQSVLIRAPLGLFISFYNYRVQRQAEEGGRPLPPFPAWYRTQRKNPVARFLLTRYLGFGVPGLYRLSSSGRLAAIEEALASFWFVGRHERAGELIAAIARDLGVAETAERRNVGHVRAVSEETLGPSLRARILRENALDQALFERWQDRGWRSGETPPPPTLPRFDQARLIAEDAWIGIAKKAVR